MKNTQHANRSFFGKYSAHLLFFFIAQIAVYSLHAQTNHPQQIVVAKDGSGNFASIQGAIDAVPAYPPGHITIKIKNGQYREKIVVPASVKNISIIGEDRDKTVILYDDYSGKFMNADTVNNKVKFGTSNSYTMCVHANDVHIENLTIKNIAGRVGQALALNVDGDRFVMKNCTLSGNQDTLFTANDTARQYYSSCLIEGTTDFIFGNATAVFQNCVIKSLSNSYITAASTAAHQSFGYVFLHCQLIAADEAKLVYLGRPWRPFAAVVFINCQMGKHIRPEGWHNWGKTENESTARYAEYKNTGEGAGTENRVSWSRQLSKKEAGQYTLANIFRGWNPLKEVTYPSAGDALR